jgi:outer membrane protein OmpA-like peptidoglycan-associated protein
MTRNIPAIAALLAAVLLAASCNQTSQPLLSEVSAPQLTGYTDDPAPGYENVKAGSEEEFILSIGRRVYFAANSAELDDITRETLDLQAAWLNQNPAWLIKLQGYADDSAAADKSLSDKRARAVMDYLASRGVDARRMWAKGYGNDRQVLDCKASSCKALNRRVVVNLRTEFDEAAPQFKQARG